MARGLISSSDIARFGSLRDACYRLHGYYPDFVITSANDGPEFFYATFPSYRDATIVTDANGKVRVCATSFMARTYELQSAFTPLPYETMKTIRLSELPSIELFVYQGMSFRIAEWSNRYIITDGVTIYPSSFAFRNTHSYLAFDKRIAYAIKEFSALYGDALRAKVHLAETYERYRLLPHVPRKWSFGAVTSVMGTQGAEAAVFYWHNDTVAIWQSDAEVASYLIQAHSVNDALNEAKRRYHNFVAGFEVL